MNGNKQLGTWCIVGGIVFGILLGVITGQWFWLAIGAGVGTAIGASMYTTQDRKSGTDGDGPAPSA